MRHIFRHHLEHRGVGETHAEADQQLARDVDREGDHRVSSAAPISTMANEIAAMYSPPNFSASEPPPTRATAASNEKPTPPRMPADGQAEMVQVDPVGREPGGQRQEAAEGDEIQEHQAPGARLVGRGDQRAPGGVAREQFLAAALRDTARFLGADTMGAKLEIIGVARQPAVDAGADQQEGEPGQIGAGQPERGDGERQHAA